MPDNQLGGGDHYNNEARYNGPRPLSPKLELLLQLKLTNSILIEKIIQVLNSGSVVPLPMFEMMKDRSKNRMEMSIPEVASVA